MVHPFFCPKKQVKTLGYIFHNHYMASPGKNFGLYCFYQMAFVFQCGVPDAWMLEKGEYTMSRFAKCTAWNIWGWRPTKKRQKQSQISFGGRYL